MELCRRLLLLHAIILGGLLYPYSTQAQFLNKDSITLEEWSEQAYQLELRNELDSAIQLYKVIIGTCRKHDLPVLGAKNMRYLGGVYTNLGQLDTAEFYLSQALAAFEVYDVESQYGKTLTDIGNIHNYQGHYEAANTFYYRALDFYEGRNEPSALAVLYGNIGAIHFEMEDMEAAIRNHELALGYATEAQDSNRIMNTLSNLGSTWDRHGDDEKAIQYYQQAMNYGNEAVYPDQVAYIYNNVAAIYRQLDSLDQAIIYVKKALSLSSNLMGKATFKRALGTFYVDSKKYALARTTLNEALIQARLANLRGEERDVLWALYQLEVQSNNAQKALEYLNKSLEIKDSIQNENIRGRIHRLQIEYEASEKEKENQRLRAENAEQELKLVQSNVRSQRQFWGLLLLLSLLGGILVSFWLYQKNVRNQQELLTKDAKLKEEQLKQLQREQTVLSLKAMMAGEETERKRLSQDLHDGLGSLLSTIKLSLNESGSNTIPLVDKASLELRRIAHNLMPESLSRFGLLQAVEDMVDEINYNGEIRVDLQVFGEPIPLPNSAELPLYRIIQELLNNILKHAKATEVLLQFLFRDHQLFLMVEDNGIGFNTHQVRALDGLGLRNIQSRIEFLNGQWDIESNEGSGTSVSIRLDLNKDESTVLD